MRIAIKIGAPDWHQSHRWGDLHLARAMARAFRERGHDPIVQVLREWHDNRGVDVVLHMRGLSTYETRRQQTNLMWLISHPEAVEHAELERYDAVFVASDHYARELQAHLDTPVFPLLQCAEPDVMYPDRREERSSRLLFVGNSRKVRRKILDDLLAVDSNPPLAIYGGDWDGFEESRFVKATHEPYASLRQLYSSCDVLLNDHWDDMRRQGFASNRLYDALACGATIVSDAARGMHDVFGDLVHTYNAREELADVIARASEPVSDEVRARRRSFVVGAHTPAHRVDAILNVLPDVTRPR